MKIFNNVYKYPQFNQNKSAMDMTAPSFRATKHDAFIKTGIQDSNIMSKDELYEKMIDLDFYKKDAKVMCKRTDIFSRENIQYLEKIDFSGFKNEIEDRHKYFLLYAMENISDVKEFLKIISPIKRKLLAEDLEGSSPEGMRYLLSLAHDAKNEPTTLEQYLQLIPETGMMLDGPYHLLKKDGLEELTIPNVDEINKILFGKQPKEQAQALKNFEKETGIHVIMDYNLPIENLEYLREFINIEKAKNNEICPIVYFTNFLGNNYGSYLYENYMLINPIVNFDGAINEDNVNTLQHENTHYLDCENLDQDAKPRNSYFYKKPGIKGLVEAYLNKNATMDRDEFIAEFRSSVQSNKIQKFKNKENEITYRCPFNYELDAESEKVHKQALIRIIGLYYTLNGPQIKNSPLAEPSKEYAINNSDYDFIDITEKEIIEAIPKLKENGLL